MPAAGLVLAQVDLDFEQLLRLRLLRTRSAPIFGMAFRLRMPGWMVPLSTKLNMPR